MKNVSKEVGTYTTPDGAELYYEVRGEGAPIIFLYGIACVMNHWHHQIEYFSQKNRVYLYDFRGHHKSTHGKTEHYTVQGMAQDLKNLLDHWGIDKAHFVGHSFGVPVLVAGADLFPERVLSFSFVNGFAHNPIKGMFGLDVIEPVFHGAKKLYEQNPALFSMVWKKLIDNPLSMVISGLAGGFNLKVTQFKDIEVYARGVAHLSMDLFLPLFEDMMNFDGRVIAQNISVPTLIITGDQDFVTPYKFQEDLHRAIKGSELVKVPYGSHCCQLDFPEYVNLRLEKHFDHKLLRATPPEADF